MVDFLRGGGHLALEHFQEVVLGDVGHLPACVVEGKWCSYHAVVSGDLLDFFAVSLLQLVLNRSQDGFSLEFLLL